jgi:hypothetical protein
MGIATSCYGGKNSMSEPESVDMSDQSPAAPPAPRPRAVGSPLSTGVSRHAPYPSAEGGVKRLTPPPPGRALGGAPAAEEEPSSLQRTINALVSALPLVQRLLPLLDGSITTAVSNLLTPHPHPPAPQPSEKVDLTPVEDRLLELRSQHKNLREQITEQNNSLKRVEDQLEMVREATDRNTLEQQELLEDLKSFGNKVKIVAIIALGLVAIGFILTLALFLHVQRVLP